MKIALAIIISLLVCACSSTNNERNHEKTVSDRADIQYNNSMTQDQLKNESVRNYEFLKGMYSDEYFPKFLVDKTKSILVDLCAQIESDSPKTLEELYTLTHSATNKINDLQPEFEQNDSELETAAREVIAEDFAFIASSYGFTADVEELIATREW